MTRETEGHWIKPKVIKPKNSGWNFADHHRGNLPLYTLNLETGEVKPFNIHARQGNHTKNEPLGNDMAQAVTE